MGPDAFRWLPARAEQERFKKLRNKMEK